MSNKLIILAFLLNFLLVSQANAVGSEKLVVLKRVNSTVEKLIDIAQRRQVDVNNGVKKAGGTEIKRLIQAQSDIDVLTRLARASRSNRFPGRAEDQVVDDVMDEAWTRCIARIEQIGGNSAIEALEVIGEQERIDGADSLAIRSALQRLKQKK